MQKYLNYIGGEWRPSASGESFENRNPANTKEVIGLFPRSVAEDVEQAVSAAKEAADKWRRTPAPKRAEMLYHLGEILVKNKNQFAQEMTARNGQDFKRSRRRRTGSH
jgi:aldehyde dehydrogenase (NAD+)